MAAGTFTPNLYLFESAVMGGGNEMRISLELWLWPHVNQRRALWRANEAD
jgi:hypothetical protein